MTRGGLVDGCGEDTLVERGVGRERPGEAHSDG